MPKRFPEWVNTEVVIKAIKMREEGMLSKQLNLWIENLLEELREPAFKTAKIELERLDEFSKANGFPKSQNIEPWDISYWTELLRKEKLNLDQESLRPWFPLNDVLKGLFKLS